MTKSALIVSYAEIDKDPRVRNQVLWLVGSGYRVDTLGRGATPEATNGQHWKISRWPLPFRLLAYAVLPNRMRFRFLMGFWLRRSFSNHAPPSYDLVLLNTIDFLPWGTTSKKSLVTSAGQLVLDLHEYSASQGIGFVWKSLFRSYQLWLTSFIASPEIDKHITVSSGIADLYRENFNIPTPQVIRNVPPFVDLVPATVNPKKIRLIHHGKADISRGLRLILEAVPYLSQEFEVTFMLVGSARDVARLKAHAERLGISHRISFKKPVSMGKVSQALNEFDAEIIFFPPETENLKFVLPNKYFEAIQGRLAIITGPSPEILAVSSAYSNALSTEGWLSSDLARAVNTLTAPDLQKMKSGSHAAASELNLSTEGTKFVHFINS